MDIFNHILRLGAEIYHLHIDLRNNFSAFRFHVSEFRINDIDWSVLVAVKIEKLGCDKSHIIVRVLEYE